MKSRPVSISFYLQSCHTLSEEKAGKNDMEFAKMLINDMEFAKIKARLDADLGQADPRVGIAFAPSLFAEFHERELFTVEDFGLLGTSLFPIKVPAYQKSHFAFCTWAIDEHEYRVEKIEDPTGSKRPEAFGRRDGQRRQG
jgi:hypothetical protein